MAKGRAILLLIVGLAASTAANGQPPGGRDRATAGPARAVGRPGGAAQDGRSIVWRSERVCGLNSLYLLLRCAGAHPDYVAMQAALLKDEMASLYDLRATARDYGMALKIVRHVVVRSHESESPAGWDAYLRVKRLVELHPDAFESVHQDSEFSVYKFDHRCAMGSLAFPTDR